MSFAPGNMWEGLGGPIRLDELDAAEDVDPTLDMCCEREEVSNREGEMIRRALQRHDIVAEKERRRRNLVTLPESSSQFCGCRCCYDPNSDGGEYRALIELREKRQAEDEKEEQDQQQSNTDYEDAEKNISEAKVEKENDDSDSDDEFDYLLDEDLTTENEELKLLEEARRAELEYEILKREVALQHGYGVLRQLHPSRLLRAAGLAPGTRDPPMAVVLHLVDPESIASASLDLHLEHLAATVAKGTKFMRSGGRTTLQFDADLANKVLPHLKLDRDIPALIAVRDGVVVNVCPGLAGLTEKCGREEGEIVSDAVTTWLDRSGVLLPRAPNLDAMCRIRPEEEALMEYLMTQKPVMPKEEETLYNCGVHGCNKAFFHEHVGIQNEQQEGLVVPKEEVLGETENQ